MNCITAYITGVKAIFGKGQLWLLLYALNFLFAVLLAYPLSGFLGEKLGTTLAADKLLDDFNFTVVNDFVSEYGDALGLILSQSTFGIVLYLLLSVFLVGGILTILKNKQTDYQLVDFWTGGGNYFWRMLRLAIYFLLIQGALLFTFFMIFSALTAGGLERFHNEGEIINRAIIVFLFYSAFATFFFMVHDYAKIQVVTTNKKWLFQPIRQAFGWVFRNLGQSFLLYLLNIITFGILFFIYLQLDGGTAILAIFLIGQFFVVARIGTKLLNLASALALHESRS